MSVSNKVKAVLNLAGKSNNEFSEFLGMTRHGLSNKFYRDSFAVSDLIKLSEFTGYPLMFAVSDDIKIVLDMADLKEAVQLPAPVKEKED